MKKLLIKLIIFLAVFWGLFAAAVLVFPKYLYNDEYALYTYTKGALTETHDVLILGDSRAQAGILAEDFSSDVQSLALPGGTAVEGYYVLKDYLAQNPAPEAIIISYAPYHFELGETYWERAVKFNFLSPAQSLAMVTDSVRLQDDIELRGNGANGAVWQVGRLLLYQLKFPPYYLADVSAGLTKGARNADWYRSVTAQVREGRGHFYFGRDEKAEAPNSETARTDFEESALIGEYFDRLLTLAEENDITVYFFCAPMSEISEQAMDDDFVNGFQAMMAGVQKAHPSAVIDASFHYLPDGYFGDESHVNPKGAEWFTEYIQQKTGIE